jgi:anti-sigma factor RsiW
MGQHMAENLLTCQELVEIVTDYLENKLSPDEHQRFDAHLAGCSKCTRYVEQMRITIRLTGRLSETNIHPEGRSELLHAFRDWKETRS